MHRLADGVKNVDTILEEIHKNPELMNEWILANSHVTRKHVDITQGIKRTHVQRMVKSYGYKDLEHARQEAKLYNHTVVSVEYLNETQDVGTITIDGNETFHNHHTFVVSPYVVTFNSNLGEIDDAIYFRNKLFTAMNFPKNYFSNEDPQTTRITLSALDIKFARQIERLQSSLEDALWEICDRHLKLRGVPTDLYDDLRIELTPPSDHRELSRVEVLSNRIQNATSLKGSQLFADFDIYVDWLKMAPDDAKEKLARLKIQKLEDLKIQVLAQNPIYLGVAPPPNQNPEIGATPGGPNPMLGPAGGVGMEPNMPGQGMPGSEMGLGGPGPGGAFASDEGPPKTPDINGKPLPDPTDEDIMKYDLEIQDYGREQDIEDIDYTEV
jgi:hypothetical protein